MAELEMKRGWRRRLAKRQDPSNIVFDCLQFEDSDFPELAKVLAENHSLTRLSFYVTNMNDAWFSQIAEHLCETRAEQLHNLEIKLTSSNLTKQSIPLLKALKEKGCRILFERGEFVSRGDIKVLDQTPVGHIVSYNSIYSILSYIPSALIDIVHCYISWTHWRRTVSLKKVKT